MLRVNSSNVIVVPPFECAWLAGEEFRLSGGTGCLCFEVKGENDVTLILKSQPGSKRWQPLQRLEVADGIPGAPLVEQNYTIILGSHRNTKLKFEKNGHTKCMVGEVAGAQVSPREFSRYWINYAPGVITVGTGLPGTNISHTWQDPEAPIPCIQHVGLSCWDKHVSYRNVMVLPALNHHQLCRGSSQEQPGVPSLLHHCQQMLKSCTSSSLVCVVAMVAELLLPTTESLYAHCVDHLADHFSSVYQDHKSSLGCASPTLLVHLLSHPRLCCSELTLFEAVAAWAGYCGGNKQDQWRSDEEVQIVAAHLRFPLLSAQELQHVASHPFTMRYRAVREYVQEVEESSRAESTGKGLFLVEDKRLVRAADTGTKLCFTRYQRRLSPQCEELMYVFDGDKNGVIHFLGSSYGREDWVNPVLARKVQVKASSPPARHTDGRAVVSGQFVRTSYAGPQFIAGTPTTWWMVDLGPQHRLICNYYTMRQDGSQDFVRNWVMQGSPDGADWSNLRHHVSDTAIKLPGQYASWSVTGPAATIPYRFFRVLLTGPTTSLTSPHNFCMSYIELYGYLLRIPEEQDGRSGSLANAERVEMEPSAQAPLQVMDGSATRVGRGWGAM